MIVLVIGTSVTLVLLLCAVALLRSFNSPRISSAPRLDYREFDHRPMQRLLDPAEFRYLRRRKIGKEDINKLRRRRRKIYRLYLLDARQEFSRVQKAVKILLVSSHSDRPDLATFLTTQTLNFYRNLVLVEFCLTLHACGFEKMPQAELLRPLGMVHAQLRHLTTTTLREF